LTGGDPDAEEAQLWGDGDYWSGSRPTWPGILRRAGNETSLPHVKKTV
jgi:hypothetical protein